MISLSPLLGISSKVPFFESFAKLKNFCKAKDIVNRTKWQPTDVENLFTNPTFNRGQISKIYKELRNLTSKEPNNPIKKMGYRAKQRIHNRGISNDRST